MVYAETRAFIVMVMKNEYKMNIERIKQICASGKIKWTAHGLERLQERDISTDDIKECIEKGEIIEDYPDDFPSPSALVFGHTVAGRVLHVVVGTDDEYIYIVTAYYPTTDKFESDLKTRR